MFGGPSRLGDDELGSTRGRALIAISSACREIVDRLVQTLRPKDFAAFRIDHGTFTRGPFAASQAPSLRAHGADVQLSRSDSCFTSTALL